MECFLLYVDTHVLMDIKGGYAFVLNVIYHPLYSMNNFVTSKSKLPQDEAQVCPYIG